MKLQISSWLRLVTTVLIVVILVAVAIMAVRRVRLLKPQVVNVTTGQVGAEPAATVGEQTVSVYHNFKYTESVAGKTVFELTAQRTLSMSTGWQEIEGVRLQFYSDGHKGPLLSSDRASFNLQTRDARLKGAVHVEFANGAFVDTERGHFDSATRHFVTDAPVVFANPQLVGRAAGASYGLADDQLELTGNVRLQLREGGILIAPRVRYLRQQGRIVLPAGGRVTKEGASLTAPFAVVVLDGNEGTPQRLEMRGGVVLDDASAGGDGGTASGWAERVVANRDSGGRWHVSATTDGRWVTLQMSGLPDFLERTIRTWRLRAVVGPEGLQKLWAEVVVCVTEIPLEGPTRTAAAHDAQVWFENGRPGHMEMTGDVVVRSGEEEGRGDVARFLPERQMVMLRGSADTAKERAVLISGASWLNAEEVQLFDTEGRASATGGVQGQVEDASLMGTDGTAEAGPLHFASDSLRALENGELLILRDDARVWQGRRLLLADEIRYRPSSESLEATGHVRTTIPAQQLDEQAGGDEDALVVARSLTYDHDTGSAVYSGGVRYTDPVHLLSAQELKVAFTTGSTISTLDARGQVEIVDRVEGRRMTGDSAHYDAETDTVTMEGTRVALTDSAGNVVSGTELTWNQASGRVTVSGTSENPSETIYHPEEKP